MVVVGAAIPVAIVALTAGTSLPYQDPTPEMLAQQAREIAQANRMLAAGTVVGVALLGAGVAVLVAVGRGRHMEES
jgi:Mn2+/Fe2+ NRAMP family transporter